MRVRSRSSEAGAGQQINLIIFIFALFFKELRRPPFTKYFPKFGSLVGSILDHFSSVLHPVFEPGPLAPPSLEAAKPCAKDA